MIYAGADFHIDRSLRASIPSLREDGYKALLKVRDYIIQDKTDEKKHVILAGDIFDKNVVNGYALHVFSEFIDALWENNIYTYFISGNHDSDGGPAILGTQGAISLHSKSVELDGRHIYGINYMPVERLIQEFNYLPASVCDILVIHIPSKHLLDITTELPYVLDFSTTDISAKTVIVGDVHVKSLTQINDKWILSPGALHPCAIDQSDECGIWKLSEKADLKDWKFVEIPGRKIYRFKVTTDEELETLLSFCSNTPKTEEVSVIEVRHTIAYTERLNKLYSSSRNFIFVPRPNILGKIIDIQPSEFKAAENSKITSLLEAIPFAMDVDKEPDVAAFLTEVLTISDFEKLIFSKVEKVKEKSQ